MSNRFVFLTPAYNCEKEIVQTILTMISQSYKDWRAIIIDDVSTDNTTTAAKELVENFGIREKFTFVRRDEKYGEVRNTIEELEWIDDDEIIVRLDGGDWLLDNNTLYYLNEIYKQGDPAFVWTNQRWGFTFKNISSHLNLKEQPDVYKHPWVTSHLKTYRSENLKIVPRSNFFDDEGNWIMIACDQAVTLPMLHLAIKNKKNLVYFPIDCYHYSIDLSNPTLFTNNRSIRQKQSAEWIRERGFLE